MCAMSPARDAGAAVLDDERGRIPVIIVAGRQPDEVAGGGVLDRVLQQRVHGKRQALPVGLHRGRAGLSQLPVPRCRWLPAQ